ncbi:hypothetical protein PUN28_004972 [Cardiocondyla obscurior]|uniref:Uncharacterized protein n=1 Tax=Cardiocondyla obscurior TaxID=286306 RepID=A0AAW2GH97_9HYME
MRREKTTFVRRECRNYLENFRRPTLECKGLKKKKKKENSLMIAISQLSTFHREVK